MRNDSIEGISVDIADYPESNNIPIRKIIEKFLKVKIKPEDKHPRFLHVKI
jgi:hypothetical protein